MPGTPGPREAEGPGACAAVTATKATRAAATRRGRARFMAASYSPGGVVGTRLVIIPRHTIGGRHAMNNFFEFAQAAVGPIVLVFTVSNLASMGLQVLIPKVIGKIRTRHSSCSCSLGAGSWDRLSAG